MGRVRETMIGFQIDVTGYQHKEGKLDMYTGHKMHQASLPGLYPPALLLGLVLSADLTSWEADPVKKL